MHSVNAPVAERMRAVDDVVNRVEGGVFKRIDEGRELLELLRSEHPELLARCFWIEGWLEKQDHFLTSLAGASQSVNPYSGRAFPRPWPGSAGGPARLVNAADDESAK